MIKLVINSQNHFAELFVLRIVYMQKLISLETLKLVHLKSDSKATVSILLITVQYIK